MSYIYTCEEQREDLINQIKCVGESLIKNAESMVGNEEVLQTFSISVSFCTDKNDPYVPQIDIFKTVMPDTYLDYLRNKIHEQEFDK